MMKRTKRTLQDESSATSLAVERAAMQLAAQRMTQFLDGLLREFADPNAPPLTQKDIIALVHELRH